MEVGGELTNDDHRGVGTPRHHVQADDEQRGHRCAYLRLAAKIGARATPTAAATAATADVTGPAAEITTAAAARDGSGRIGRLIHA